MSKLAIYLIAGIAAGPSAWNIVPSADMRGILQICAIGYLLIGGLEISFASIRCNFRVITAIAVGAFFVPLVAGFIFSPFLGLVTNTERWVVATALSVSALPVAIQLLKENNLYQKTIGQQAIGAACLCDLAAWAIFLYLLPPAFQKSWTGSHIPVMAFFFGVLLSALITLPKNALAMAQCISTGVFAPVFFFGIGLSINLWKNFQWKLVLATILLATITKLLGAYVGSRLAGMSKQNASIASITLNARGAMEVYLALLAYQSGLISEQWLTILVAMALFTSVMSGAALRALTRRTLSFAYKKEAAHQES